MHLIEVTKGEQAFSWISLVTNLIVGIVVAIVSALVTVSLALKKFYSQRWWEKKWNAYNSIMEALHHMKNYDDHHLAVEDRNSELPEQAKVQLERKLQEATQEFRKHRDIGSLVISQKAVNALDIMANELDESTKSQIWYEAVELHQAAIVKCLQSIRAIAKSDLKGH